MAKTDIDQIDRWLKETSTAETTLGKLACRNTYAMRRIRAGTAAVSTLESVMAYIKRHPAVTT